MQWLNEPASWQRTGDVLRVNVDPGTDFWRVTGYGYIHDNGHVYGEPLPGDLDVSVRVRGTFASQYDQAGIMLRADEQTWLKTGLEFFEGRLRLSTVLTLGWSSWIVADLPPGTDEVSLRVSRRGEAVEVRYSTGNGPAELAGLVFLPPGCELLAGIGCAAPEGSGFTVDFHDLRIVGRDWAEAGSDDWAAAPPGPAAWDPAAAAPGPLADELTDPAMPAAGGERGQSGKGGLSGEGGQSGKGVPNGESERSGQIEQNGGGGETRLSGESELSEQNGQQPAGSGTATGSPPGGKTGGRGKGRIRPAAAGPADAADEWISLLTADPADEPPGGE